MAMKEDIQKSDEEIQPAGERRQARFVLLSEAAMVASCVLVFFGFLSILIRIVFPAGSSLIIDPDAGAITDVSWSGDV